MITVEKLNKKFCSFTALEDINIHVEKGEVYGFLGQNGAGKSTTINILTGLSKPTSGRCIVNGCDLSQIQHYNNLSIGYLPEEPAFYPWLTGLETLNYIGNNENNTCSRNRIEEVLEWVKLSDAAKRKVGGYSRGMKQRLGIAVALIHDPDLLLLDEPSSALDPEGRSDVLNLILDLKERGKTVFLSSHILSDIERVCDRVSILNKGKIVLEKPLAELIKENVMPILDITLKNACDQLLIKELKQIEGVIKVESNNNIVSVWVKDTELMSSKILNFISTKDLVINAFSVRSKKLEDIFLEEVNGK